MGSILAEVIFDYLVHHSYFESAAVVGRDLLDGAVEVSPKDRDEVRLRAGVAEAVIAGRIDDAMSDAERVAPGVLQAHPSILFKLHCQKFMELVGHTALCCCYPVQAAFLRASWSQCGTFLHVYSEARLPEACALVRFLSTRRPVHEHYDRKLHYLVLEYLCAPQISTTHIFRVQIWVVTNSRLFSDCSLEGGVIG